jgi:hypothetical protein
MGFNPAGTGNGQQGFPHRRRGFCRRGLRREACFNRQARTHPRPKASYWRILVHPYGPHIFRNNSKRIFTYLSRFTDWRFYEHRVLAEVGGKLYPLPINRLTLNCALQSQSRRDRCGGAFRSGSHPKKRDQDQRGRHFDVGEDLCEKFFRGYTRKQLGARPLRPFGGSRREDSDLHE